MKNIILTGMRGSGKSHMGSLLAKDMGWDFVDTDQAIEQRAHKKISQIVVDDGWEIFRNWEQEVCREMAQKTKTIISLGGGTLMNPHNVACLKKSGNFIFLFVPGKELLRRLKTSKNKRPPLRPELSLWQEISEIWNERKEVFRQSADIIFRSDISSTNPHESVQINIKKLKAILKKKKLL